MKSDRPSALLCVPYDNNTSLRWVPHDNGTSPRWVSHDNRPSLRYVPSLVSRVSRVFLVLLVLGLVSGPALARKEGGAEPCGPEVKDPQRLAEGGLRLYKEAASTSDPTEQAREYERALRCFTAAMQGSRGAASKLYHPLGLVYEKLDRDVEAVEAYERFLADVPEDRRKVGVTKQISDKLKVLKRRVAQLDIDTVSGLDVRVDEKDLGKAPLKRLVVVAPGTHIVTVGNSDVGTQGAEVAVVAGQVRRVDLTGWHPRGAEVGTTERPQEQGVPGGPRIARPPGPAQVRGYLLLTTNRNGASLQVDGMAPQKPPLLELALPPGDHLVSARDGAQSFSRTVTLAADEHRTLDLHFPVKTWVWVATGIAAAAVVGGAVGLGVYYGTGVNRPDAAIGNWH